MSIVSAGQEIRSYDLIQAENEVFSTYGDRVSAIQKKKSLLKFGRNGAVGSSTRVTVWNQSGDETYVTTNAIDTISSSSGSDSQEVTIEGHTVSGTGADAQFTFVTQTATLNGQTKVVLGTPLARMSRIVNNDTTVFAGDIYGYEDTAITAGVPNDATKIHAKIVAGDNQTFKASTTFSNSDYYFVSQVYASVSQKTSAAADIRLERRLVGGVFRPFFEFTASYQGGVASVHFSPCLIVPKNSDVRLTAPASTTNVGVNAGFNGFLASVI